MGHFHPVPPGAVVTSAPLCTTFRCYQKVKKTPKFLGLQLELIDLLFPATFQVPLGPEFLCRERLCGRCFGSAVRMVHSVGAAHTMGQADAHDKKNSCLRCLHKLFWNTWREAICKKMRQFRWAVFSNNCINPQNILTVWDLHWLFSPLPKVLNRTWIK